MRATLISSYLIIISWLICDTRGASPAFKVEIIKEVTYRYMITDVDSLRIVRLNEKGERIRTFSGLGDYYEKLGIDYSAAMNGGIFEPDRNPTGLLIQNKKELSPLNLKEGYGNFYLKPNGVFYLTKNKAGVIDSKDYRKQVEDEGDVIYATQSGPLLLSGGRIHSKFKKGSKSQKLRNGVGILSDGRIIIAISNNDSKRQPNLYEFASFFLSKGCKDALYLDGTISEFREKGDTGRERHDFSSFLVIEKKKNNR